MSFDLVLDDTHHTDDLTPAGGQTLLEQSEVNASFLAAVSSRTHANNRQVNMAWNADTGAAMVQVAVNLLCSAGQIAASTATLLSRWGMDEAGGTATVTIADVKQSNGVIHVIDTVLLPKA